MRESVNEGTVYSTEKKMEIKNINKKINKKIKNGTKHKASCLFFLMLSNWKEPFIIYSVFFFRCALLSFHLSYLFLHLAFIFYYYTLRFPTTHTLHYIYRPFFLCKFFIYHTFYINISKYIHLNVIKKKFVNMEKNVTRDP